MKIRRRLCLALLIAVLAGAAAHAGAQTGDTDAAAPGELRGAALLAALRGGGYILYFRHTSTDFGAVFVADCGGPCA